MAVHQPESRLQEYRRQPGKYDTYLHPFPQMPLIFPGDNLVDLLIASLQTARITLEDGDILVVTQKIVSKAEGRLVNLETITPSKEAVELAKRSEKDPRLVEIILRESKEVLRVRPGTIIVEHKLGFICASAGIDHSNVEGKGRKSRKLGVACCRKIPTVLPLKSGAELKSPQEFESVY